MMMTSMETTIATGTRGTKNNSN